ncbi:hypothetical protein BATDEDRAFT_12127 [Batrachochytrium dendrobatidis JAM81]|uniref:GTP-binding protein n=1 Tax=Batrachochytrium dendrobatidis (strain JAM81 / FGSC 10211) TaxID=684364 RepID=F4P4G7_BATDJ|nr:uncharacterized protein BATDEDRAFT_12127 [Batrachochytrium dendrobatidis JAM81]EGF79919.1 hypothetical protein BATDEDRAFT_12127 [Batrachochytrium dendrobatidis JAM81]|eukprot:XP_006679372.1 hypothetical protein BATDEDRAFT_12127 [Batrachochytrium dendrobatidis JAM81]
MATELFFNSHVSVNIRYGSSDIASAKSQSASSTIPGQIFGSSIETPLASSGVANKPRLLIIGLRRSGKSSILNVVFHKMPPNETIFLESTTVVSRYDILPFLDLQLWDFPGHVDVCDPSFDPVLLFQQCGAVMFVVDAQDDYLEALERLHSTIFKAFRINPDISFEIFVHKVDGLSDDHKIETKRDIYQRLYDDLGDVGVNAANLSFHLTSIYDHSVFEAFSKVIQKLIPQLATLENLLNMLCSNTGIEKAFLFDMASKIYIATDSSPVDMQSYELCSDMIDVVLDISSIYSGATVQVNPLGDDNYQVESYASIRLNNGMALYLRRVNQHLVLVTLLREENFDRQGLIDYNFRCISAAIDKVLSK